MTHTYTATIRWSCEGDFAKGRYSRAHEWAFDGGAVVPGSASPLSVPLPYSDETAVDPEEAFIASVSSCHMMTFLDLARRAGYSVVTYNDAAKGVMEGEPNPWITRVDLFPKIEWVGDAPTADALALLHHEAHARCFIANSIKSEVVVN
ncbi:OsmC family protein [Rhodobacteraceae bacterium]|nr:OsmC family protein [Paracoccaceae bacterium]